ncbi:short-chain dehydrogenase/reductase SDR [Kribbella flavida DSM 17836]|uniref:Short-chain dehydrogenase/reductase SDR n=1 Tax=Kribbella flavida (strain DSM 17836 / JCM 10339 / NBRC 14399) TaxID=479435 RepID=D2PR42_KRIFD|nr:SDR family oxidoreductase [Kribbella flavida]ADB32990.1 short-chain dehydrogenase/reductase SDR [Kribbella flavida DSM 17836]
MRQDPITGQTVVVTGASSGIGRQTALLLAERGASVVLAARRRERIDALAASIVEAGGRALAVPTDVAVLDDVQALVRRTTDEFGRLDVIVNNAGVARLGRLDQLAVDDWSAMVDVNVRGVLHGLAAALPVFRRQGHGHVITTASTAGLRISPTMAVYAATKNAARTIMEGLRAESTDGVVRTTEISPGVIRTELADGMESAARDQIQASMREFGLDPAAVARAICFAIEQPHDVEIGSLTIRPTVQN